MCGYGFDAFSPDKQDSFTLIQQEYAELSDDVLFEKLAEMASLLTKEAITALCELHKRGLATSHDAKPG